MSKLSHNNKAHLVCIHSRGFTKKELDKIDTGVGKLILEKGRTGHSDSAANEEIRDSQVCFFGHEDSKWFHSRMQSIIHDVNKEWYHFELDKSENYQYTEYKGNGGHYTWHVDTTENDSGLGTRKLTAVLMLSNPEEYEGGNLMLCPMGVDEVVRLNRGDIALFPSYFLHKVEPTTGGLRRVIVNWNYGPEFV
jgi:hypothetical protein